MANINDIINFFKISRETHVFNDIQTDLPIEKRMLQLNIDFTRKIINNSLDSTISKISPASSPHITMYINNEAVNIIKDPSMKKHPRVDTNKIESEYQAILNKYVKYYGNIDKKDKTNEKPNVSTLFDIDNDIRYGMQEGLGHLLDKNLQYDENLSNRNLLKMLQYRREGLDKCWWHSQLPKHSNFYQNTHYTESSIVPDLTKDNINKMCVNTIWGDTELYIEGMEKKPSKIASEIYKIDITEDIQNIINSYGPAKFPNDILSVLNNIETNLFISESEEKSINDFLQTIDKDIYQKINELVKKIYEARFRNNELMLNTIQDDLNDTDMIQYPTIPQDKKQAVFGFGDQIRKYRLMPKFFVQVMKSRPKYEETCDPLVEWTPLLNHLYVVCNSRREGLIRFVIPKEYAFVFDRQYSEILGTELYKMVPIGLLKIDFFDDRDRDGRHPTNRLYYYLFYDYKSDDPVDWLHLTPNRIQLIDIYGHQILIGSLFYNRMVTYREFNTFVCILKYYVYRSIQYPEIIFFSKNPITDIDIKKKNLVEIKFECIQDEKKITKYILRYESDKAVFDSFKEKNVYHKQQYVPEYFSIGKYTTEKPTKYVLSNKVLPKNLSEKYYFKPYVMSGGACSKNIIQINPKWSNHLIQYFDPIISVIFLTYHKLRTESKIKLLCSNIFDSKIIKFNPYIHINNADLNINTKTQFKTTYESRIYKLREFRSSGKYGILLYKPLTHKFLEYHEIINTFDILSGKTESVLCISTDYGFIEAFDYNYKKDISLDMKTTFDITYIEDRSKNMDNINHLSQFIKINNILKYDTINKLLQSNPKTKYDIIVSDLVNLYVQVDGINTNLRYEEFYNIKLKTAIFIFSLLNLKEDGTLILFVQHVTTKPIADLVLLAKAMFDDVHLYSAKSTHLQKYSSVWLVCNKFKGLCTYKDQLVDILNQILKNDPSLAKFNVIYNSKTKDCHTNISYEADATYNELVSIIDAGADSYNFIEQFNSELYYNKYLFYKSVLTYYNSDKLTRKNIIEKLQREQLINAISWATEFKMDIYEFDKATFQNDFSNIMLKNMYVYDIPIKFKFKKISYSPDEQKLIKLPINKLNIFALSLYSIDRLIDTRNIDEWYGRKMEIRYYRPKYRNLHLTNYVEKNFNTGPISQAWLKMYEMMAIFKFESDYLDIKSLKTFHICEAPGNFISAINHYVKTNTTIKIFDWKAQSLNPVGSKNKKTAFGDDYGYISKYKDKWDWGPTKTGDITDITNIKYYGTLTRDVQLITSDCGIPNEPGQSTNKMFQIHYASLLFMILNLPIGSNFVAKFFIPIYRPLEISLIHILYESFEQLYFFKSMINIYSKEFYIVGKKYIGVSDDIKNKMVQIFNNFDVSVHIISDLYPEQFIYQLMYILDKLQESYIFNFKRQLFIVDNYNTIDKEYLATIKTYINEKNIDWVNKNKLRKINNVDRL